MSSLPSPDVAPFQIFADFLGAGNKVTSAVHNVVSHTLCTADVTLSPAHEKIAGHYEIGHDSIRYVMFGIGT